MVTVNDSDIFNLLKILRNHGDVGKYEHRYIGGNFRLQAIQAAVLLVKLKYLDKWTAGRINNADTYRKLFNEAGLSDIVLPVVNTPRHIYNQFVIRVEENRDELKQFLSDNGVGSEVYYPIPLHFQECFRYLGYSENDFPVSEKAASTSLALPVFPDLNQSQLGYVVDKVVEFKNKK